MKRDASGTLLDDEMSQNGGGGGGGANGWGSASGAEDLFSRILVLMEENDEEWDVRIRSFADAVEQKLDSKLDEGETVFGTSGSR